jgi:hypothetical protein
MISERHCVRIIFENGQFKAEEKSHRLAKLNDLVEQGGVVFLELGEDEKAFAINHPTVVSHSNRGLDSLKSLTETSHQRFGIDPPTFEELEKMRLCLSLAGIKNLPSEDQLRERYKQIGGIVRWLFKSSTEYLPRLNEILKLKSFRSAIREIDLLSWDDIPKSWKNVVAPFIRKGIKHASAAVPCILDGDQYRELTEKECNNMELFFSSPEKYEIETILKDL